jgi:hypothetical protein
VSSVKEETSGTATVQLTVERKKMENSQAWKLRAIWLIYRSKLDFNAAQSQIEMKSSEFFLSVSK